VRKRHEYVPARAVQNHPAMSAQSDKALRILLIRPWTEPIAPLRSALRDCGIDTRITRVDIEPALHAALSRTSFDVILFDPNTRDITREIVDERLRERERRTPVVTYTTLDVVIEQLRHAIAARLN